MICLLLIAYSSLTAGDSVKNVDNESANRKAVTDFSKEDGFKLSVKAMQNLGVTFETLKGPGPWEIPKSSLVKIKQSTGVYRKWEGWITMVLVTVLNEKDKTVTIKSVDLQDKDNISITGVPFLRMTDVDLNSDTVDSCAH